MNGSWICLLFTLILSSCGKKSELSLGKSESRKTRRYIAKKLKIDADPEIDMIRQQEAKLIDIPLPGFSQPIPEYYSCSDGVILGYKTTLSGQDLCSFYKTEMEREGWVASKKQFCGYVASLSFEKPDRVCRVAILPKEKQKTTDIIIFTGQKDQDLV